jgi:N-acetylmuramic acid 6-phosphate etherase
MDDILQTESLNPNSQNLDCLSTLQMVQIINAEDARIAPAVQKVLPQVAAAIDAIAERMARGGRLVYIGSGTSGRLGVLDASECPPTFSVSPDKVVGIIAGGDTALRHSVEAAEDSPERGAQDLQMLNISPMDSVVGITASGSTPYVQGGLHFAQQQGALTVGIACNDPAPISKVSQVSILVLVGAEVISGSTRMKAGTAQKMVLNMLSTGVMIRLGKTYGNLMIDLKASNTKLRSRAIRLVQQLCPLDLDQAQRLLEDCDWEVKTAIAAFHQKSTPQQARAALEKVSGRLRTILENELPPEEK